MFATGNMTAMMTRMANAKSACGVNTVACTGSEQGGVKEGECHLIKIVRACWNSTAA